MRLRDGRMPPAVKIQGRSKAKPKAKTIRMDPCDSKGYTHTPPRREACVTSILPGKEVGTCARKRDR